MYERSPGIDTAIAGALVPVLEGAIRNGVWRLEKREGDWTGLDLLDPRKVPTPYEEPQEWPNAYVNAGGALLLDLLIGAGGTVYSNANARIGVGDDATAVAAAQTDLQAAVNKLRKAMDATFPSRAAQVMTWKSTFASADANWVWAECALFNAAAAGTMLSRIAQAMGTKAAGTSWTLEYRITVP